MTGRIVCYSLRKDGSAYLSPDFQVREFACRDGSDKIIIDLRLVHVLQRIRDHFGKSVRINSGYRTRYYNAKVGGVTNSQHLKGTAADIVVSGVTPSAVADYAETLLPDTGGIGRYATFTHVDVRKRKARWTG
ncbi:MAG: DUF882 domain-containing protein [Oscillibacter sp.]|nr:DUF882 domain-containing protein [Oscillibacter sp.]